eukprot:9333839-Alexandrium_andersonii.AAC.1
MEHPAVPVAHLLGILLSLTGLCLVTCSALHCAVQSPPPWQNATAYFLSQTVGCDGNDAVAFCVRDG